MSQVRAGMIHGLRWMGLATLLYHTVHFFSSVILARWLWPHDFGVFAASLVVIQLVQCLVDGGLTASLIQRKEVGAAHLDSAFWLSTALGVGFLALLIPGGTVVAALTGEPEVEWVVALLSLGVPMTGLAMVPLSLLNRRLQFRIVAGLEVAGTLIQAVIATSLALHGFGIASLVIGQLSRQAAITAGSAVLARYSPKPRMSFSALRELLPYAGSVLMSGLVGALLSSLDVLIVSRALGPRALGLYNRANFLANFVSSQLASLVYRTAFPTLSRAQEDLDRLRASSLRMVSLIAAFAFPVAAGLYLVNQSFILALFGDRWAEASPVLKILCPAGGLWALSAVTGPILLARGRAGTWLALNLLSIPTATTLLLLGIPYGPEGAALGMMAYALARGLGNFACALRTLQASWIHLARELWAPFLSSITMVLVVQEGQRWVDPVSAPWLHLAVTVPAGAVVFVLALLVLGKRQLMGMIHSIHTLSVGTAPPLTSAPTPS